MKLQAAALGIPSLIVSELMEKGVCSMWKRKCIVHVSKECPRERWVTEFLYDLRTFADEEQIRESRFKKWITVDQSTLIEVVQTVDEFMSTLGEATA